MDTLFYNSYGNGQVLVLIHGFCEDSRVWDDILPALSKQYKVITIDMPGFGNSALDNPKEITFLDIMTTSIKEVLSNLQIAQCTIIGHSMGGYITLAFAEKYPEFLKGFGLFHSTANADTDFKKENRLKHIEFVKNNGVEPFVKTLIPTLFSENSPQYKIDKSLQMAKECSVAGVINALQAMRQRPDRLAVLKNSTVPVLFIAGAYDTVVLTKDLAYQASLPPHSQFEVLKNSGHMGMVEESEKSVEIIKAFMRFSEV